MKIFPKVLKFRRMSTLGAFQGLLGSLQDQFPVGRESLSRQRHRVRAVWQKRFYEHTIRSAKDYRVHDYIHMNPVKNGLVKLPRQWIFSTFHRYVRAGKYELDWCGDQRLPGTVYFDKKWM